MPIKTMDDPIMEELRTLYSRERDLTEAFHELKSGDASSELKSAFVQRLHKMDDHLSRIESVIESRY